MNAERVIRVVSEVTGVTVESLKGLGREERVVRARQLAMLIARRMTTCGLLELASAFGKKHAAVINGVKLAERRLEEDAGYAQLRDRVVSRLNDSGDDESPEGETIAESLRRVANELIQIADKVACLGSKVSKE